MANKSISRMFRELGDGTAVAPRSFRTKGTRMPHLLAQYESEESDDAAESSPSEEDPPSSEQAPSESESRPNESASLGSDLEISPQPERRLLPPTSSTSVNLGNRLSFHGSSGTPRKRPLSAAQLHLLVDRKLGETEVECLLIPERITSRGGGRHSMVRFKYAANNPDKILRHLEVWHPYLLQELAHAEGAGQVNTLIRRKIAEYQEKIAEAPAQPTIDTFIHLQRAESFRITQALDLLHCGQSFRSLESPFKKMQLKILGFDPEVCLNRFDLKKRILPAVNQAVQGKLQEIFREVKNLSITADCWSDKKNRSYLAVTAHWINREFHSAHALLDLKPLVQSHTAVYLRQVIEEVVSNVTGEDVLIHVSVGDGAANSSLALSDFAGVEKFLWCVAHRLHLVVSRASDLIHLKIEDVRSIMKSVRNSSTLRQAVLARSRLQSIIDCPTRWSSLYLMLKRFREIYPVLLDLASGEFAHVQLPSPHVVQSVALFVTLLKPFHDVTKLCQATEYPTLFQVPLWLRYLKKSLQEFGSQHRGDDWDYLVCLLDGGLDKYFDDVASAQSLYAKSSFMAMRCPWMSESSLLETAASLAAEFSHLQSEAGLPTFPPVLNTPEYIKIFLLELHKRLPQVEEGQLKPSTDPNDWWRRVGRVEFPHLSLLARVFLSVPATSAASEAVFSRAGFDDRDNRSRLGAGTLQTSLRLVRNLHLFSGEELIVEVARRAAPRGSRKRTERPSLPSENRSSSATLDMQE